MSGGECVTEGCTTFVRRRGDRCAECSARHKVDQTRLRRARKRSPHVNALDVTPPLDAATVGQVLRQVEIIDKAVKDLALAREYAAGRGLPGLPHEQVDRIVTAIGAAVGRIEGHTRPWSDHAREIRIRVQQTEV